MGLRKQLNEKLMGPSIQSQCMLFQCMTTWQSAAGPLNDFTACLDSMASRPPDDLHHHAYFEVIEYLVQDENSYLAAAGHGIA